MGNATITAEEYWGYLIQPDKTPTPLFEQFLLSIASYIVCPHCLHFLESTKKHIAPWDVNCLTPIKLAAFYRLVGGDCDALFLRTLPSSLSFIYQSLGCFHTLQPDHDPYLPPSIPALTPQGFVRWQTVQLLLGPAEHVPLLQKAVKSFEIVHLGDGSEFPKVLPKTAFPSTPDLEMTKWHEGVSEKLRVEAAPSMQKNVPETTARGEHDMDGDAASTTQSSIEERSSIGLRRTVTTITVGGASPITTTGTTRTGQTTPVPLHKPLRLITILDRDPPLPVPSLRSPTPQATTTTPAPPPAKRVAAPSSATKIVLTSIRPQPDRSGAIQRTVRTIPATL
ncbi:MAG: hypothetical protein LQ347_002265 [Umbilicaria vellea]|nr:MAG: hypothetical protein LQ347_002265 [Umbilicaria vellea]